MCSNCHAFGERNGARFFCRSCGVELHADLNASRNIAQCGNAALSRLFVNEPIVTNYDGAPRNALEFSCKPPISMGGS
jgi:transposase